MVPGSRTLKIKSAFFWKALDKRLSQINAPFSLILPTAREPRQKRFRAYSWGVF
jgi:hypothetical protein